MSSVLKHLRKGMSVIALTPIGMQSWTERRCNFLRHTAFVLNFIYKYDVNCTEVQQITSIVLIVTL